jgi:hypothetical protein
MAPERVAAAEYLRDMSIELGKLADEHDFQMAAYLLSMLRLNLEQQLAERRGTQQLPTG